MWTGAFTPQVPSSFRALCLIRHAKSGYPSGVGDHERPLAERGRREAPGVGRWLAQNFSNSASCLVSSATRTQQTWGLISEQFVTSGEVITEPRIYEANLDDLLGVLREQPDEVRDLIMVGHSPGLESLALNLSQGRGDESLRASVAVKFPTSAVALLQVDCPWSKVDAGASKLVDFQVPSKYKQSLK